MAYVVYSSQMDSKLCCLAETECVRDNVQNYRKHITKMSNQQTRRKEKTKTQTGKPE